MPDGGNPRLSVFEHDVQGRISAEAIPLRLDPGVDRAAIIGKQDAQAFVDVDEVDHTLKFVRVVVDRSLALSHGVERRAFFAVGPAQEAGLFIARQIPMGREGEKGLGQCLTAQVRRVRRRGLRENGHIQTIAYICAYLNKILFK